MFSGPIVDLMVVGCWVIVALNQKLFVFNYEAESGLNFAIAEEETLINKRGLVDAKLTKDGVIVILPDKANCKVIRVDANNVQTKRIDTIKNYQCCTLSEDGLIAAFADQSGQDFIVINTDTSEQIA